MTHSDQSHEIPNQVAVAPTGFIAAGALRAALKSAELGMGSYHRNYDTNKLSAEIESLLAAAHADGVSAPPADPVGIVVTLHTGAPNQQNIIASYSTLESGKGYETLASTLAPGTLLYASPSAVTHTAGEAAGAPSANYWQMRAMRAESMLESSAESRAGFLESVGKQYEADRLRATVAEENSARQETIDPDTDEIFGLADNHAEESYENGDRRFDRIGLLGFAVAIIDRYASQPATVDAQGLRACALTAAANLFKSNSNLAIMERDAYRRIMDWSSQDYLEAAGAQGVDVVAVPRAALASVLHVVEDARSRHLCDLAAVRDALDQPAGNIAALFPQALKFAEALDVDLGLTEKGGDPIFISGVEHGALQYRKGISALRTGAKSTPLKR